jgi:hypothetical protein
LIRGAGYKYWARCGGGAQSVDVTMAIGSPLIVSIVSLQHIFLLTVHPVGGFVLQHHKTARNQTGEYSDQNNRLPRKKLYCLSRRRALYFFGACKALHHLSSARISIYPMCAIINFLICILALSHIAS